MKKTSSKQSFLQFRNDYELLLNNSNIIKSLGLRVSVVHELFKLTKYYLAFDKLQILGSRINSF